MAEPVVGISAVPDISNARYFKVEVAGPKDVSFTRKNEKEVEYCVLYCGVFHVLK